jgi:hypothetical protein
MFESWFSSDSNDAISILKRDHDTVKELFDQFENAKQLAQKRKIVGKAIEELKIHAAIEEEIFYPAVRAELERDMMTEADEEHHVAKVLIGELEKMTGKEEHYDAKFTVLAENIRHHIKEEEGEMLPKARKLSVDFDALGEQLMARKEELRRAGVPVTAEERAAQPRADSSAKNAKKTKRAPKTRTAGD